jgi:predicted Zn-dependent protease
MPKLHPILAALLLLAACASSGVNQGDFNIVSLEEEWQIGRQLEADLARRLDLVRDAQALDYLNDLGQRLVRQTEMGNLPWRFHLVRDRTVNAFNIPGGHVYVHTGLVEAARNASELAGVMGHELSHGVSRHGTEQLSKNYGLSLLASVALGQNPKVYEEILAQVIGGGAMASFSRNDEREADSLGLRTMSAAGYSPQGMVAMFETLLAQRKSQPGRVQQFFSTHPLTENRIKEMREEIAKMGGSRGSANDGGFESFRRRVS